MTARLLVGDVHTRIREIPDGTVDALITSPPFLALRKYGDNDAEMGSEANPAAFIDALLELCAEFRRVLAPHGSIAIELGDTYSGSGGAGGDYNENGLREGQAKFSGSARKRAENGIIDGGRPARNGRDDNAWPLSKSLAGVPEAFMLSLAYGWNVLRRDAPDSPAGRWRVRNVIVWARPNPPVGALGDKVRPATSYITVACTSDKRWFDLDAVRTEPKDPDDFRVEGKRGFRGVTEGGKRTVATPAHPAGAPPLDWWEDDDPTGHATLVMPTQPYPGPHFAIWPSSLAQRLILMMCPLYVCPACGPLDSSHDAVLRDLQTTDNQPVLIEGSSSQEAVLFADLRAGGGHADTHRQDQGSGLSAGEQAVRLHRDSVARTSDGVAVGSGVRASTRNGGPSWTDAESGRGRTSQERSTGRQSDRESGTASEGHARSNEQGDSAQGLSVPPLRQSGVGLGTCPRCGGLTRAGHVLDPFCGSGTTIAVAQGCGRDATGIELYESNADLIRDRLGMFLETA